MQELFEDIARLDESSVERASAIAWIKPPSHLVNLIPRVRRKHGGRLNMVHGAIRERLATTSVGEELGAFLAASELALVAWIWRQDLDPADQSALRAPWQHLSRAA